MKRYYLSPYTTKMIAGQESAIPKVATYPGVQFSSVGSVNPRAAGAWALCVVDTPDHASILADPDIIALPDYPFDGEVGAISNAAKTKLTQALNRFLPEANITLRNGDAYRVVFRKIGQRHQTSFDENAFDSHLSTEVRDRDR